MAVKMKCRKGLKDAVLDNSYADTFEKAVYEWGVAGCRNGFANCVRGQLVPTRLGYPSERMASWDDVRCSMNEIEIEKAVGNVAASFAIEGIYLTDENKRNGLRILRGEVGVEDIVSEIRRKYGVPE